MNDVCRRITCLGVSYCASLFALSVGSTAHAQTIFNDRFENVVGAPANASRYNDDFDAADLAFVTRDLPNPPSPSGPMASLASGASGSFAGNGSQQALLFNPSAQKQVLLASFDNNVGDGDLTNSGSVLLGSNMGDRLRFSFAFRYAGAAPTLSSGFTFGLYDINQPVDPSDPVFDPNFTNGVTEDDSEGFSNSANGYLVRVGSGGTKSASFFQETGDGTSAILDGTDVVGVGSTFTGTTAPTLAASTTYNLGLEIVRLSSSSTRLNFFFGTGTTALNFAATPTLSRDDTSGVVQQFNTIAFSSPGTTGSDQNSYLLDNVRLDRVLASDTTPDAPSGILALWGGFALCAGQFCRFRRCVVQTKRQVYRK